MARSILILVCLGVPPAAGAAAGDEAALARADSLISAGLHAEAAAEAAALLATVDARGDGGTPVAARTLVVLLRAHLRRGGRLDPAAAAYAERLLTLVREPAGPAAALLAKALMLAGQVAEREGDYAGAREVYAEALAVHEAADQPANADQVSYLLALANVRTRLGDYDGVGAMYEQALAVATELGGPRSELASKVLANYAIYAKRTGDLPVARDLYGQTLAVQVELYGEEDQSVARTHFNLGNLLAEMTEYDAARTHYLRSLAVRELLLGSDSPEVARTLAALALLEQNAADLLKARAYAERAVAIQRGTLPPLHPQRAGGLSVLAVIQADLGDLEAARVTLEEVLAVYEKAYGPTHINVGGVVAELGRLNEWAGDAAGALAAYDRARSIFAADEGGREQLAGVLQVEARLRAELGPDPGAVALARRSLDLRSDAPGPGNRALARPLATLGFCLWRVGEFARADSCLGQALQCWAAAGAEGHPYHLLAQLDLARVRFALGDRDGALDLALAVEQGRRTALRVILRGLPERLALEHVHLWPRGVEFAASLVAGGGSADDVARTWDEVVRSRALVLDEMALRYRTAALAADAAADSLRRALAVVTRDEAGLLVAGWQGEDGDDLRERFATLRSRHEELERRLGDRDPAAAGAAPTLARVAAALPGDMALVGYLRREAGFDAEAGYLALVLPVGQRLPVAVDLGPAAVIDRLVRTWRDEAGPGRDVPGRSAADAEAACRRAGTALRARVWDPLLPYLEGSAQVGVVPDGSLHLVNFAALPTGEIGYLIDEPRPLVLLDAERDLVDRPRARPVAGALLAFGAPAVGPGPAALGFAPLPASAEEVQSITALWRRARPEAAGDGEVLALLGAEASEASFKSLATRYRAVHLATHGFWLTDGALVAQAGQRGVGALNVDAGASATWGGAVGPMLRSGLVLAGDASGEDGVLTAGEIAVLDLGGTDWVVLSACESGVGTTTAGEGVLGLRRAFRLAGARNLLLSLWPLEDQVIRDWMLGLYAAHLTDRLDLVPSAWQAARRALAARRAAGLDTHPHTWAAFIACGG